MFELKALNNHQYNYDDSNDRIAQHYSRSEILKKLKYWYLCYCETKANGFSLTQHIMKLPAVKNII